MTDIRQDGPVLDTYQAVVTAFCQFLEVSIHTILYERGVYPPESFMKARRYNYPVRQNRYPVMCKWIGEAVSAVEAELLKCTVASTSLIILSPPPSCVPIERYVFSTDAFPRIPSTELQTPFASPSDTPEAQPVIASTTTESSSNITVPRVPSPVRTAARTQRYTPPPLTVLPEQFRAALAKLTPACVRLGPLPGKQGDFIRYRREYERGAACTIDKGKGEGSQGRDYDDDDEGECSFTLAIELRDTDENGEEAVYRDLGDKDHDYGGAWIVSDPRENASFMSEEEMQGENEGSGRQMERGKRMKTVPVRTIEAGPFAMELWLERAPA